MTWGAFKKQVEARGVTDAHEILYIDVSTDFLASAEVEVAFSDAGVMVS